MKYSVRIFSHDNADKSFVAEASDLCEFNVGPTITLVSDFGNEAEFFLFKVVRTDDEDNEITHWEYLPTNESVAANPRLKGYSLTVFND